MCERRGKIYKGVGTGRPKTLYVDCTTNDIGKTVYRKERKGIVFNYQVLKIFELCKC